MCSTLTTLISNFATSQGGGNFLADALSRMPQLNCPKVEVVKPLSHPTNWWLKWLHECRQKKTDKLTMRWWPHLKLLWRMTNGFKVIETFVSSRMDWRGWQLKYMYRGARDLVLGKSHESKSTGHFGFVKTLHLSLKVDIERYVTGCPICTSDKQQHGNTPGLLQPVGEPSAPWREISIGFYCKVSRKLWGYCYKGDDQFIF